MIFFIIFFRKRQFDDFIDGGDLFIRAHDGEFAMRFEIARMRHVRKMREARVRAPPCIALSIKHSAFSYGKMRNPLSPSQYDKGYYPLNAERHFCITHKIVHFLGNYYQRPYKIILGRAL